MTTFRVVLLGLGFAGQRLLLPALRRLQAVEVVAGCDPDPRARATAELPRVLGDPGEALDVDADAVIVATPPETHGPLAVAALGRGRHVYLEKPMGCSLGECVRIEDAARRACRTLQLGFAYRYNPLWRRVHALVSGGRLRAPLEVSARFNATGTRDGWLAPIVDLSCHHVDLVSWLLGAPPTSVFAAEPRLLAEWPDGSRLDGTYEQGPPVDIVRLRSGDATVFVDRLRGVRLHATGVRLGAYGLAVPALARAHAFGRDWERSFEYALAAFVASARAGASSEPGPGSGTAAVAIAEATFRSLASGEREPVELRTEVAA